MDLLVITLEELEWVNQTMLEQGGIVNHLFIINDSPYGNERPYNALRLALNLVKRESTDIRVFLTGDGVLCAQKGQKTPDGYYNVERIIRSLARRGKVAT